MARKRLRAGSCRRAWGRGTGIVVPVRASERAAAQHGAITIWRLSTRRNPSATANAPATPVVKGIVRNIALNGIRAWVTVEGQQYADMHWGAGLPRRRTADLSDVQVIYEGGGTAAGGGAPRRAADRGRSRRRFGSSAREAAAALAADPGVTIHQATQLNLPVSIRPARGLAGWGVEL